MKKFLATLLVVWSLFFASTADAEIKTYTGTDDYTVGERETQEDAQNNSKLRALRNAQEQAGFYISTRSRSLNLKLMEDDILVIAQNIVNLVGAPQYRKEILSDGKSVLIHTTVTVEIDTDDLDRRLEEFSRKHQPSPSKNSQIPSDAAKYNGHSYKLIDMGLTWKDAKAYCESVGGHLVTITSAMEQTFVQDLIVNRGTKGYYWTGGVRNSNGDFVWITGEKFSYSNWGYGEPSNSGNAENVITIYKYKGLNGIWNDLSELGNPSGKYPFYNIENSSFICEWDN
ncbi:MAG: hypothetical protein IJ685_12860 [Selenomonadaceae bacterium]|nr:hypothetical protein [Selenomonadaceae bacterium]